MNYLALDLGTKTGWAMSWPPTLGNTISANSPVGALRWSEPHDHDQRVEASGVLNFTPKRFESSGMRFVRFRYWFEEMLRQKPIVYYEEVRRHRGVDAAHIYGGFLAHLQAACEAQDPKVEYVGVPVGTIKKHATGKGNAKKEAMTAWALAKGYKVADDNEADALALLHYALEQRP